MIHIQLPAAEAERLEQAFRHESDPKYKDRLQIVRLASRDRPHQDIARDLATTPRSVQRWLNAYLDKGLDGLRPRKAKGREPKIPAAMAEEIKRWVIQGPAQQGLDRANWTHEELADHLFKTKGIKASGSAMQRFCRKVGIRVYRPTDRFLRGKPEKQAQAKEDIKELKEKAQAGEIVLLSRCRHAVRSGTPTHRTSLTRLGFEQIPEFDAVKSAPSGASAWVPRAGPATLRCFSRRGRCNDVWPEGVSQTDRGWLYNTSLSSTATRQACFSIVPLPVTVHKDGWPARRMKQFVHHSSRNRAAVGSSKQMRSAVFDDRSWVCALFFAH